MISIKREIRFWEACTEAHVPLWECPSVLFIFMGALTIVGMLVTYHLATAYHDPQIVIVSVSIIGALIFSLGVVVVASFDRVVQASTMRMEFVSIASHQLRAPLTSMKWVFGILLDGHIGALNDKQRQYLGAISADNERMITLINNLLDVSRIEEGRLTFLKQRVDLCELTADVVKNVSLRFKDMPQKITVDTLCEGIAALADERYVRAIIENLLDNALRYGSSEKNIFIRLKERKNFARIEVEDFGAGIPRAEQRYVFRKFFRSQKTESSAEGKGVGLFIARYLAQGMGGRMGFHSEEQKGSLFWVELPMAPK